MIEIEAVSVALVLPDGRHVAQRRDRNSLFSPGKLAYFGGGRKDSDPCVLHTAYRELADELGLRVELNFVERFAHTGPAFNGSVVAVSGYAGRIASIPDTIYEGIGAEAHYPIEMLERSDVPSTTKVMIRIMQEQGWH